MDLYELHTYYTTTYYVSETSSVLKKNFVGNFVGKFVKKKVIINKWGRHNTVFNSLFYVWEKNLC